MPLPARPRASTKSSSVLAFSLLGDCRRPFFLQTRQFQKTHTEPLLSFFWCRKMATRNTVYAIKVGKNVIHYVRRDNTVRYRTHWFLFDCLFFQACPYFVIVELSRKIFFEKMFSNRPDRYNNRDRTADHGDMTNMLHKTV